MIVTDSEIIAALAARLTDKTIAGTRVYQSRFIPFQPEEVPCINIVPSEANYILSNDETVNSATRNFTIIMYAKGDDGSEVLYTGNDPVFMTIENMKNIVRNEFNNIYENLNKLVYRVKLSSGRTELKPESSWVYGISSLVYTIETKEKVKDPKNPIG